MNLDIIRDITLLAVIALNGLWYYIKYVLSQNGYETHWFSGHLKDIANLQSLHDQEQDLARKRRFMVLIILFYLVLVLFFVVLILTLKAWGFMQFS